MQRHVISKERNASPTPFQTVSMSHRNVSGFASSTIYLHDCRNDRIPKNGLGSISITASFRSNLPSPGRDRLVLFTMAACVYRNASRHATR